MTAIVVERTVPAEPARVWEALTQPDLMDDWMCPNPDLDVTAHADAREGGAFRINMGGEYTASGHYVRIEQPAVLECTWSWEHETLVTTLLVELTPVDGGTRLVLTHSDFSDEADAADTRQGWDLSLDRLTAQLGA